MYAGTIHVVTGRAWTQTTVMLVFLTCPTTRKFIAHPQSHNEMIRLPTTNPPRKHIDRRIKDTGEK